MEGVAETLRQIRDGNDFSPPASILRISAASATLRSADWPYSIADNVAHAAYWQRIWIARLAGDPAPDGFLDQNWPRVAAAKWAAARKGFLTDLDRAIAFATRQEPCRVDERAAVRLLARIAQHDAYHVGQWALLKRSMRSPKPKG